ncbi:glycosyltransferase [Candidatus Marinimicrobia bacterium]|nr:glycosyltransferase [Candidatus Neomarinimicrobiota bacterium]MDC1038559.1 glycosyltransferase [Candidatus Neomarinimicrobiota bacterium]
MKITVYITNYNYGRFLKQAVESVLIQTEQDFEIIIIDDGSTDESLPLIESYIDHPKIKIVLQQNKGLTISNNLALKLSRGKYIMRLDADDYLVETALEKLSTVLDKKSEIGMVFGDYYLVDENENILEHFRRHDFSQDVKLLDQPAHGACTMFRVECLKKLGGYDESITRQDGYELWLRFIEKFEVSNINTPLFYYRQHGKNLTSQEDKLLDTRTEILKKHANRKMTSPSKGFAILPIRGSFIDDRSLPFTKIGDTILIDRAVEFILNFSPVTQLVLTTPDRDVIDYANDKWKNEITIIQRPKKLSYINSPLEPVIQHALKNIDLSSDYDFFMLTSLESPFKKSQIIESGINIMQIFEVDTVVGVMPERSLLLNHDGTGMKFLIEQGEFRLERNELFKMVPGYLVRDFKSFQSSGKLFGEVVGHVMFDQLSAFRITNQFECDIADFLAKKHLRFKQP